MFHNIQFTKKFNWYSIVESESEMTGRLDPCGAGTRRKVGARPTATYSCVEIVCPCDNTMPNLWPQMKRAHHF